MIRLVELVPRYQLSPMASKWRAPPLTSGHAEATQ